MSSLFQNPDSRNLADQVKALKLPRARLMAQYLLAEETPFARLLGTKVESDGSTESLFIEIKVTRGAEVKFPIHRTEPIAIAFEERDRRIPDVTSLRTDFPEVPHRNMTMPGEPISFCLYDKEFDDLRAIWTAAVFVDRIQQWLSQTASGDLHQIDQGLEPRFNMSVPKLILPPNAMKPDAPEFLRVVQTSEHPRTYRAFTPGPRNEQFKKAQLMAWRFEIPPVTHGTVNHANSFGALTALVLPSGFDLVPALRRRLTEVQDLGQLNQEMLDAHLCLLITVPHRRTDDGQVEMTNTWAFTFDVSVAELGIALDVWAPQPGGKTLGKVIIPNPEKNGADLNLAPMIPVETPPPKLAALLNGEVEPGTVAGAIIGAGALGGQVAINLARSAYGKWALIDKDVFLPHNFMKHVVSADWAGFPKAGAVATECNQLVDGDSTFTPVIEDVIHPRKPDALTKIFDESELLVDCSASVVVSRALSKKFSSSRARRVSFFLSPSGRDLVMIAEDSAREIQLQDLEGQYLRAIVNDPQLNDHLRFEGTQTRYARTCADITNSIPNHLIAMHAGIATAQLKKLKAATGPRIAIWTCDADSGAVTVKDIEVHPVEQFDVNGWEISADGGFIQKLYRTRSQKLPNETGASLIGFYDLDAKRIVLVDTLPTPPDSIERPTEFIRGNEGNAEALNRAQTLSANQILYLGEWHSHPPGASTRASEDDRGLFSVLSSKLSIGGEPAVMLIVGEKNVGIHLSLPGTP